MTRLDGWVLETTTGPDTLDGIQRVLDDFFTAHAEVPDVVCMRLAIAAGEVGANIIEHAGAGHPVRMRMTVDQLGHRVRIGFTDDGVPCQIDLGALPAPDDMAERGRGLRLARSVLGELSYHRDGAANRWTLISERFGAPAAI